MYFTKTCILLITLTASEAVPTFSDMEVILREGDSIEGDNFNTRYYLDGYCDIWFPDSGDLDAGVFGSQGIWHVDFRPNRNSFCTNGGNMMYELQDDGNFVAKCNGQLDYMTHSHQGERGNYFLAVDDHCYPHIFKGTFGCDSVKIEKEIWTSDLFEPLGPRDRLYKGQVLHDAGYEVVLNSLNGNLEVREYGSHGSYDIVWASEDEWDEPPGSNIHDFYVKITDEADDEGEGHLILVGIDYTTGPNLIESTYFDKDLGYNGDGCFKLGYEAVAGGDGWLDPVDLVAVPCDDRRNRRLRRDIV